MKKPASELKAPIAEIFFSYQGEGMYVGQPQVFVRFCGCNLRCGYCDTPQTQSLGEHPTFYSIDTIIRQIKKYAAKSPVKGKVTVALTGGEPLLYSTFLKSFLPKLKQTGANIYLETNGTLPESLKKVLQYVAVVAMDIKLPSACGGSWWEEHKAFLKLAKGKAFVKVVVTADTTKGEIDKTIKLIRGISPNIPLVFQPVTPIERCRPPEPFIIHEWVQAARKKLRDVHVLPQMHKLWDIR